MLARLGKRLGAQGLMAPAPHVAPRLPAALALGSVGEDNVLSYLFPASLQLPKIRELSLRMLLDYCFLILGSNSYGGLVHLPREELGTPSAHFNSTKKR